MTWHLGKLHPNGLQTTPEEYQGHIELLEVAKKNSDFLIF